MVVHAVGNVVLIHWFYVGGRSMKAYLEISQCIIFIGKDTAVASFESIYALVE